MVGPCLRDSGNPNLNHALRKPSSEAQPWDKENHITPGGFCSQKGGEIIGRKCMACQAVVDRCSDHLSGLATKGHQVEHVRDIVEGLNEILTKLEASTTG